MVIVCTSNLNYLDKLCALVNSGLTNDNNITFYCRLVNVDKNQELILHERVEYMFDYVDLDETNTFTVDRWRDKVKNKTPGEMIVYSQAICYYTHIKYDTIYKLMNMGKYGCYLYLDADTIIRKSISVLGEITTDIGVIEHDSGIPWQNQEMHLTTGGLMFFNHTIESKKIVKYCRDNIKLNDIYSDERVFNEACKLYKPTIFDIVNSYKDEGPEFSRESKMWSGHGLSKTYSPFLVETFKYR